MAIKETKLNLPENIGTVKPIPTNDPKPEKILGYELVPKMYSTTAIVANKGSGKTNALWHILSHCANKNSFVFIFSNTLYSDSNWDTILEELDKRKIGYFAEDDTSELERIIKELSNENKNAKLGKDKTADDIFAKFMEIKKRKKTNSKSKIAPKYFFIFDDVSEGLKTRIIRRFIKQHRHYKTKVIISTQVPTDLDKGLRKNMDQWLLFAGHDNNRLDMLKEAIA